MAKFGDLEIPQGNDRKKADEIARVFKFTGDWTELRLVGDVETVVLHWIDILPEDADNWVSVPRVAVGGENDPYLELADISPEFKTQTSYWCNAILRSDQSKNKKHKPSKEEKKAGHLLVESKSKSPVVAVRFPPGAARKLKELVQGLNKGKDLSDEEKGRDVMIRFDKNAAPHSMYSIQGGDQAPLTAEEKNYLLWPLDKLYEKLTLKEAKKDAAELKKLAVTSKKPKKGKGKKGKK